MTRDNRKILFLAPSVTKNSMTRPLQFAMFFRDKHTVTIIGPAETDKPIIIEEKNITFKRLDNDSLLTQIRDGYKEALLHDVVVACDGNLYSGIIGCLARLKGKRFIFDTGEDHIAAWFFDRKKRLDKDRIIASIILRKRLVGIRIAYLLRFFSHRRTVATELLQRKFGGRIVAVPIDIDFFQMGNANKIKTTYSSPLILHLGTIQPYKGFENLVKAFPLIEREIPNITLLVVGTLTGGQDGFAYSIKERAEQMSKNIHFLEAVKSNEETRDYFAAADCVVITSEENVVHDVQFPIKLGLAMAAKKPIVAWNVGILPKVLGDSGFLVDPTPEQISKAIIEVLKEKEKAESNARMALERAENLFSYNSLRKPLDDIYFGTNEVTT